MATKTDRIDLRLSRESINDLKAFRAELELSQKRAAELKNDLKKLTDVMKAQQAKAISRSPNGVQNFLGGNQFKEDQRVKSTLRLNTAIGQQTQLLKQQMSLSKEGNKFLQDRLRYQEAINLSNRTSVTTVNKITSLTAAQNKLEAARVRLGMEASENNRSGVKSYQRIVDLLQRRVEVLREANREEERGNRRRERINNFQNPDRELLRSQMGFSRQANQERLFGDGGAGLFGIQAGLMGNYAVMGGMTNGLRNAGRFTASLDLAMRNLQAITVTTDNNMQGLRDTLVGVSEETRFTAVEVGNASVTLGQAGLATNEITEAARAVSLLATATGSDLPRAVDIATSVMGVFNMETSQVAEIADVMTEAVNSSKLDLEKLTLGLQYSGNIAAQLGVRFDELTAALGAMANSGIRSGSTLGTGMRQIMISLMAPTDEFIGALNRVGLTAADVDVRTQGLYGALANMRDAGFTAADAIQVFEVRAAAAYNALSNNLDQMLDLEAAFQGTSAATAANETQMRSFSNQLLRFGSVMGSVASTGLEPLLFTFRNILSFLSDMFQEIGKYENTLRVLVTTVASLGAAFLTWRFALLIRGLASMVAGSRALAASNTALTASWVSQTRVVTGLSAAYAAMRARMIATLGSMRAFSVIIGAMGGPIGMLAVAAGLAVASFISMNSEADTLADTLDKAQTSFDNASGEVDDYATKIGSVDTKIEELISRYDRLKKDQRLLRSEIQQTKAQFVEMGLDVTQVGTDVDSLIEQLTRLREELREEYTVKIGIARGELDNLLTATESQRTGQQQALTTTTNTGSAGLRRATADQNGVRAWLRSSGILDDVQSITSPETDYDKARVAMVGLNETMNSLVEQRANTTDDWGYGEAERLDAMIEYLATVIDGGQEVVNSLEVENRLRRDQGRLQTDERNATNMNTPQVGGLSDRAMASRLTASPRMQQAVAGAPQGDALAAYAAADTEFQSIMSDLQEQQHQLNQLASNGEVTRQNQIEIQTLIDTARGEAENQMAEVAAAAGEMEQFVRERASATNLNVATDLISAIQDTTEARLASDRQLAEDAIEAYRLSEEDRINQAEMDATERKAAFEDLDERLAELYQDLDGSFWDFLEGVADDNREAQEAALEAEVRAADAAFERAKELAEATEDLVERNEYLEEALLAIQRRMAAALALVGIRSTGNDAEDNSVVETINTTALRDQNDVREIRTKKPRGGGGKDKDPIQEWVDGATSQINAISTGISESLWGGSDGVASIESIIAEARDRMDDVTSQIGAMQGRLMNGSLTAAEQERLNTLVEQHGRLAQFVNERERELIAIKYEQGDIMGGMGLQIQQWARESLDLTQTVMSGMEGVLNGLKGSLAGFFQAWTDGTKSGKEAFRDLAMGVIRSLHQMFAEMLAVYALQRVMGMLFPNAGIPQQGMGEIVAGFLGRGQKEGGRIRNAAGGERVRGNVNRDSVPYNLMDGEYVLRRSAAQSIGYDQLDQMNAMGNRMVATSPANSPSDPANKPTNPGAGTMNIYLIDERASAPSLGPQDVIAVINDDISRGGSTKKLIKSVQTGAM